MSLSVLNTPQSTPAPVEAALPPKIAPAPHTVAAPVTAAAPPKADTVSISPAAHQAADGDRDAS